jgi:hypothetical protein
VEAAAYSGLLYGESVSSDPSIFVFANEIEGFGPASPVRVSIGLRNSGQVAAVDVKSTVTIMSGDSSRTAPLPEPPPFSQIGTVGPSTNFYLNSEMTTPIPQDQFNEILTGKRMIYVYGKVTYSVSGKQHQTSFCFYYGDAFSREENQLEIYKEGNAAN